MQLLLPQNIYSAIFVLALPKELQESVKILPSALITSELNKADDAVAFLPSLDLIKNQDCFISSKICLSFDGELSPAYLSFPKNQDDLSELLLRGDVSTNEIVLSKIIFLELFNIEPEIKLDTQDLNLDEKNYLLCGNLTFEEEIMHTALSFADQVNELIEVPYVSNILVSKQKRSLLELEKQLVDLDLKVDENINEYISKINLPVDSAEFIKDRIGQISFEMNVSEKQAVIDLIKLPYFHGVVEDIFDIKFTDGGD